MDIRLAIFSTPTGATAGVRYGGYTWYGDDSPHLADSQDSEQARPVKTVKVQVPSAEGGPGSDRRLRPGRLVASSGSRDRYRLGHRPVGSHMAVSPRCLGQRPPRSAQCTVRPQ